MNRVRPEQRCGRLRVHFILAGLAAPVWRWAAVELTRQLELEVHPVELLCGAAIWPLTLSAPDVAVGLELGEDPAHRLTREAAAQSNITLWHFYVGLAPHVIRSDSGKRANVLWRHALVIESAADAGVESPPLS